MSAPRFEPEELRSELDRLYARKSNLNRPFIALFGETGCDRVDTKNVGPVEVRSVASELALRRAIPELHDGEQRVAFLIGWPQSQVPVDLSWRFASAGKVHRVGKADRLRAVFGGPDSLVAIDPGVARSRLGSLLLAVPSPPLRTSVGRITFDLAYETWLRAAWGLGEGSSLGLDTLLAWAATHGRQDDFRALMDAPDASGVREELREFLGRRVSEVAPLVWDLWEQGKGRALLQFAILFEALGEADGGGPIGAVRTASKHALGLQGPAFEAAWRPLGRAVDMALRELQRVGDPAFVRQMLVEAQTHLDASEQAELVASNRLPIAWRLRLDAFGRTLEGAAAHPTIAAVEQARSDLLALERHAHFTEADQRRTIECAEMATRLLAWLVARTDPRTPKGRHTYAEAEGLAVWYAQEGGYLDWARHRSRGAGDSVFGRGISKVLAEVDRIRVEQDRRFAQGLVAWLEEHQPQHELLPIDEAAKVFGAQFLERDPQRRALVLLIDGMAWAQAVSLLESLDQGSTPWCPVAWNVEAFPKRSSFFTPVIASLPSVTNISRSAFFAGKPMEPGKKHNASDNAKHWAANKAVKKLFSGMAVPKLMLRGEGFTTDGSAAREALTLIADTTQPIVALVINAIDETLKADTQARGAWTADEIGPLRELLEAAREAGRAVLITSDHGHVSGQRLEWTGFSSGAGSSRWRPWREEDAVHEYEVAVPYPQAWAPAGDGIKGVICLADDEHSYSNQSHYGEHGGATLAEVLAPTFMIACENLQPQPIIEPDRALELRRVPAPDWWHLDVRPPSKGRKDAVSAPSVAAAKVTAKTKDAIVKERAGQLRIQSIVPAEPGPRLDAAEPTAEPYVSSGTRALIARVEKNPLFLARAEQPALRDQVLRALEFLLERNNHAPSGAFASHLGDQPYRAGGLVSSLSVILNVDGYEVLTHDPVARLVRLNAEALKMGFGLS